jgi:hypothetical protein
MNQMIEWIDAQVPSATSVWVCFFSPVFKLKMDLFWKNTNFKNWKKYIQVFTLIIKVEY